MIHTVVLHDPHEDEFVLRFVHIPEQHVGDVTEHLKLAPYIYMRNFMGGKSAYIVATASTSRCCVIQVNTRSSAACWLSCNALKKHQISDIQSSKFRS